MGDPVTTGEVMTQIVSGVGGTGAIVLIGRELIKWLMKRSEEKDGNGKTTVNVSGGNGKVQPCAIHDEFTARIEATATRTEVAVRELAGKVDTLSGTILGSYAKRTDVDSVAAEGRTTKETVIKTEAQVDMLKDQVAEAFARLNGRNQ